MTGVAIYTQLEGYITGNFEGLRESVKKLEEHLKRSGTSPKQRESVSENPHSTAPNGEAKPDLIKTWSEFFKMVGTEIDASGAIKYRYPM